MATDNMLPSSAFLHHPSSVKTHPPPAVESQHPFIFSVF